MTLHFGYSFALRHGLFVDTRLLARGGRGSTFPGLYSKRRKLTCMRNAVFDRKNRGNHPLFHSIL
jgi:hypothetical protein